MKDMLAHLEKLRKETAECEIIAKLALDDRKRELFARLADHYRELADEIDRMVRNNTNGVAKEIEKRNGV
jgi:uncharacterized protein YdcH (DUF465 family)